MVCYKCGSTIADDAVFCHKCGSSLEKNRTVSTKPEQTVDSKIEDIAKYDIVLVEINTKEDLNEKAHMAIAYILYEDEIKNVAGSSDPEVMQRVQDESIERAYKIAKNAPIALKRAVRKKEAIFFKERLANYGVIVLNSYCLDCGGQLNDTSEKCTQCGQNAVELSDDNTTSKRPSEQLFGESNVLCPKCGTLSQGVAEFCRKCGNKTGEKVFPTPSVHEQEVIDITGVRKKILRERFLIAAGLISIVATVVFTIILI